MDADRLSMILKDPLVSAIMVTLLASAVRPVAGLPYKFSDLNSVFEWFIFAAIFISFLRIWLVVADIACLIFKKLKSGG